MKYLAAFCIATLIFVSCKKAPAGPQGDTGPQGPDGPMGTTPTGIITGSVTQYDEYGGSLSILNTVTVSIKGTKLSTVTNVKGTYTLSGVTAGIHVLEYKGQNTQIYRNTQVSFPGNGTIYVDATIYNKPSWSFSNAFVRDTMIGATRYIRVTASVAASTVTASRYLLVLFSKTNAIDNTDPVTYDYLYLANSTFFYIPYNQLYPGDYAYQTPGYPAGTTYYAKVYAITIGGARYLDAATHQFVYYSVNDQTPPVFTLTMP